MANPTNTATSKPITRRTQNEVQFAQPMDTERQVNFARLSDALQGQGEIVLYLSPRLYLGAGEQVHLRKSAAMFKLKSVKDAEKVMREFEKWAKGMDKVI